MFPILIFLFGLVVGSFLNVIILRTYNGEKIFGRSKCSHCGKKVLWYDNIPLLSFFVLGGRCRFCRKKISWQYPLVELSTAVLFVLAYMKVTSYQLPVTSFSLKNILTTGNLQLVTYFIFISFLIIIFVQDLRWMVILDKITIPAAALAFFFNILLGRNWLDLVFGAIIGGGFFLFQYLLSRGRWVGGGDIRLGVFMGALLGWQSTFAALFLAYISGALVSLILVALKIKSFSSRVPFGTFLSVSTLFMLFYGEKISEWYFNIII